MVQYVCNDDSKEAKEQNCSAGIDHWMEHPHSQWGAREVRYLLETTEVKLTLI